MRTCLLLLLQLVLPIAADFQWSADVVVCPVTCGVSASIVARNVLCIDSYRGTPTLESFCDAYSKPAANVTCPATSPCSPAWYAAPVQCPTTCGLLSSTLPRAVLCQGLINGELVTIAESYCTAAKPPSTVVCPATKACVHYAWDVSDEACPTTCGLLANVVTHTVRCLEFCSSCDKQVGEAVSDSFCDAYTRPAAYLNCPATTPCSPTWYSSAVQCPTQCGLQANEVSRNVYCQGLVEGLLVVIDDEHCEGSKPAPSVVCPATPDCVHYRWALGAECCPETCGLLPSTIHRTVNCIAYTSSNPKGAIVAESFCAQHAKPESALSCPATPPCAPFWHTTSVKCPTCCGLEETAIPRTVECRGLINGVVLPVADSWCTDLKPATSVVCPATPACVTYEWNATYVCPTACGLLSSSVPQYFRCIAFTEANPMGFPVADLFCANVTKPAANVNCPATLPCAPYWDVSNVHCPRACGVPAIDVTRKVVCKGTINGQVEVISDSFCIGSKPSSVVHCPATKDCGFYVWKVSAEYCPSECGHLASVISRDVVCVSFTPEHPDGLEVADSFCVAADKPSDRIECPATPPCAPYWFSGAYECPLECGQPASSVNRLVACKGIVNGQIVVIADSYCEGQQKPSQSVACPATPECNHYRWEVSDEDCPEECGLLESTLTRDVTCVVFTLSNPQGAIVADSYCDSSTRPSGSLRCPDTPPCAPFWFSQEVQCPSACGLPKSTVRRLVQCKGLINNVLVVVSSDYCTESMPSEFVQCPATPDCSFYKWQLSSEYCPLECGLEASVITRSLVCLRVSISQPQGLIVSDSFCDADTKPDALLYCPATAPCAPYWFTGEVKCPTACGQLASTATRIVQCKGLVNGQLIVVADSYCAGTKPSAVVSCPATPDCLHYKWLVGPEQCPTACGLPTSTITRTVVCLLTTLSNPQGTIVADSFCQSLQKPNLTVACPETAPCAPFWFASEVHCPIVCGLPATNFTRLVQCKGLFNGEVIIVADSYCSALALPDYVTCPATPECLYYRWNVGPETCPLECGLEQSVIARSVRCVAISLSHPQGVEVADSFCDLRVKPATSLNCPETSPCAPYWFVGEAPCPTACGLPASTLTRLVQCKGTVNGQLHVVADSWCPAGKPSIYVSCPATPDCIEYDWSVDVEECPAACGLAASILNRTVTCVEISAHFPLGRPVAESFCDAAKKPDAHLFCPETSPCAPYWFAETIACPYECGLPASTIPRLVQCKGTVEGVIIVVADSWCADLPKPSLNVSCPATAECVHYKWQVGNESCPTACGLLPSTIQGSLICLATTLSNSQGTQVAASFCDQSRIPDVVVHCPATAPCAPFWSVPQVQCPTACGLPATAVTRTVQCKGTINGQIVIVSDSFCVDLKPGLTVLCPKTADCVTYQWAVGPELCPDACGLLASTVSRTVACLNISVSNPLGAPVADSFCNLAAKPAAILACPETEPCAPYWFAETIKCPTECGLRESIVDRVVQCKGTINNEIVVISDSFCAGLAKPAANVTCPATVACAYYSWLIGNETCPTQCGLVASVIPRTLLCIATSASNPMGSQVAESFCDEDHKPAATLECPATAPCAPYWFAPELQCPSACGLPNSTLSRLVQCKALINGEVVVVEDSYCANALNKPSSTVYCPATADCGAYVWVVGPEKCPTECGLADTYITISIKCVITSANNPMGSPVADSFCDAALKPVNQLHCAATAPCAPYWFGEFVHCPTACGSPASHVNRLVQCLGTVAGQVVVVAESYCAGSSKPANLVLCPATQDCICYKWANAPQPCPTECGLLASVVSQHVVCLAFSEHNKAGTPVADSFCDAATKPVAELQCPATAPCAPYWFTSEVQCPTYCGLPQTNLTRSVQCKGTVNGTIIVVDDKFCPGAKPAPFVICPATAECVLYKWQIGNESCPLVCGLLASDISRSVRCLATTLSNPSGTVVADSFCMEPKPDALLSCPATLPCAPYWFVDEVHCPTACGFKDSIVPRLVQCKGTINGQVVVIADSFCSGAKPPAFVSCYATPECITYNWVLGNESCPTACGLLGSNLTRSLFCYAFTESNPLGSRVADSFCSAIAVPTDLYLICLATPPCAPFWYAPSVQCPYGCGFPETPIQRDVVCKGIVNGEVVAVADSWCSGAKPATLIVCPATPECITYNWTIGNETCPVLCGLLGSHIERSVYCLAITKSNPHGSIVDDSFCNLALKPDASLVCTATPPCAPFWFISEVQCPTYCGLPATNVSRTVQCKGTINGQVVDVAASFCADAQPPAFVTCPATPECVFYNWRLGNEQCPTECGLLQSTIERSLVCIATSASNPAGSVVADSFCANIAAPNKIVNCPATTPCAPYWFASEVQCPSYCGLAASVVHRTVECKGTINGIVVTIADSYCPGSKPADTVTCPATVECVTYAWKLGPEACPTACGLAASTVNRSLVCVATSNSHPEGLVVANSFCAGLDKPYSLLQCAATPPCSPFWWTSQVQCPTYCGLAQSSVTRVVQCKGTVMGAEIVIADSYCSGSSKPAESVICPATAECVNYKWTVGNPNCPTDCGHLASNASRPVYCLATTLSNPSGTQVDDSFCDLASKPSTVVDCLATPPCAPFWFTSGVYCLTDCGLPATPMPRIVQCKGTINGQVVVIADSWCPMNKPPATFICPPTPECIHYNWSIGNEQCPDLCGLLPSTVTRSLVCLATTASNPLGNVVADSFCDLADQPETVLACDATAPCAPFWFTCDVKCPTECGLAESNVTREVLCKGLINGEVVEIAASWCLAEQPQPVVLCPATEECVYYNWRLGDESCPAECGMLASTVTRTLYCIATSASNPNGTILPDSYCAHLEQPVASLNCSATPPCGPFWFTSEVQCPAYCDAPASSVPRTVQCRGIVEDMVVDIAASWCLLAERPSDFVLCPATEECVTYQWKVLEERCPTDCGLSASNISQKLVCLALTASNQHGTIVADSFCAQLSAPNTLLICPVTAPCAPYWSPDVVCPAECGLLASNVSQGVVCKGTINGEVVIIADSWCSGLKPSVHCSATPPCAPFWDNTNVRCPDACGLLASFSTQGVVCKGTVNGQVVIVPDSYCTGAKPPVACPATPPCSPFWDSSSVQCPSYCGLPASNVTAGIVCKGTINNTIVIVADSYCASPKPPVVCPATALCAEYHWRISDKNCPTECGLLDSVLQRDVLCIETTSANPAGKVVADSFCANLAKPNGNLACSATPPCAPYWSKDVVCPTSCGLLASLVTQGVVCKGTVNGQVVVISDSWCAGERPPVACPATPPCAPFWSTENVQCPSNCGLAASNVTAGIVCKGTINGQIVVVADSFCASPKVPVLCPATPACVYYRWSLGAEACPTDCGLYGSNVQRSLLCIAYTNADHAGTIVAASFCEHLAVPNSTLLECHATPPCAPFWFTQNVQCPTDCGLLASHVSAGVVCKGLINGQAVVIADSWCVGEKPSVPCPATAPCSPYWCPKNAVCPTNCGLLPSTTTEGVVCRGTINGEVVVIADSWCSGPRLVVQCPATPPCSPFWSSENVKCPSECGLAASNVTAGLICKGLVNGQPVVVADSWCAAQRPPVLCPATAACVSYRWQLGPEACPTACGFQDHLVIQSVLCVASSADNMAGTIVADSFCDIYSRPNGLLNCAATAPCAPFWFEATVSCPTLCGFQATNVTRTVQCKGLVNGVLMVIADRFCTGDKPAVVVTCPATAECLTYNWAVSSESCPAVCGQSAQVITRTLQCLAFSAGNPAGVAVAHSFCSNLPKPDKILRCPAWPCQPAWSTSNVQCPTKCGLAASTLARSVKCKGLINNRLVVVADSWCTGAKPAASLSCPATAECVTYNWTVSNEVCPTECGKRGSVLKRTVQCVGTSLSHPEGVVVADTFCKIKAKPKVLLVCCATAPCAPFWWTSNVSCPTKCGVAAKNVTRTVRCKGTVNGQLIAVANSWCADLAPSPLILCPATAACYQATQQPAYNNQPPADNYNNQQPATQQPATQQPADHYNNQQPATQRPATQQPADNYNTQPPANYNAPNMPLEELAPMQDKAPEVSHKAVIVGSALGATLSLAGIALCVSYSKRHSKAQEEATERIIDA